MAYIPNEQKRTQVANQTVANRNQQRLQNVENQIAAATIATMAPTTVKQPVTLTKRKKKKKKGEVGFNEAPYDSSTYKQAQPSGWPTTPQPQAPQTPQRSTPKTVAPHTGDGRHRLKTTNQGDIARFKDNPYPSTGTSMTAGDVAKGIGAVAGYVGGQAVDAAGNVIKGAVDSTVGAAGRKVAKDAPYDSKTYKQAQPNKQPLSKEAQARKEAIAGAKESMTKYQGAPVDPFAGFQDTGGAIIQAGVDIAQGIGNWFGEQKRESAEMYNPQLKEERLAREAEEKRLADNFASFQTDEAKKLNAKRWEGMGLTGVLDDTIGFEQGVVDSTADAMAKSQAEFEKKQLDKANTEVDALQKRGLNANGIEQYYTKDGRTMTDAEKEAVARIRESDNVKAQTASKNEVTNPQLDAVVQKNLVDSMPAKTEGVEEEKAELKGAVESAISTASSDLWENFNAPQVWYESDEFRNSMLEWGVLVALGANPAEAYLKASENYHTARDQNKRQRMRDVMLNKRGYTEESFMEWVKTGKADSLKKPEEVKEYSDVYRTKDGRITHQYEPGAVYAGEAQFVQESDGSMRRVSDVSTALVQKPKDRYTPVYGRNAQGWITTPPYPNAPMIGQVNVATGKLDEFSEGGVGGSGGGGGGDSQYKGTAARDLLMASQQFMTDQAAATDPVMYSGGGGYGAELLEAFGGDTGRLYAQRGGDTGKYMAGRAAQSNFVEFQVRLATGAVVKPSEEANPKAMFYVQSEEELVDGPNPQDPYQGSTAQKKERKRFLIEQQTKAIQSGSKVYAIPMDALTLMSEDVARPEGVILDNGNRLITGMTITKNWGNYRAGQRVNFDSLSDAQVQQLMASMRAEKQQQQQQEG